MTHITVNLILDITFEKGIDEEEAREALYHILNSRYINSYETNNEIWDEIE